MPAERRVLVGMIVGAHGVRGEVTIKTFTAEPRGLTAYGPLGDESGAKRFKIKPRGTTRGLVIARVDGVADRNAAEALKGVRLYVPRTRLPKAEDGSWYQADLEGLAVEDTGGRPVGRLKAVLNYGAGDVLEIERDAGPALLLPFTTRMVPVVDVKGGRIVVDPPAETEAKPQGGAGNEETELDERR